MSTTMLPKPTLIIATDTEAVEITPWLTEGYTVRLLTDTTQRTIEDAADDLESSDKYAIIAFGTAATAALSFAVHPSRSLQAVAAYYPTALPAAPFHPDVQILLHLPTSTPFSLPVSAVQRTRLYSASPGFASPTSPTHDPLAASLTFSRTLALLRATIGPSIDLEDIWDQHLLHEFTDRDATKTLTTMVAQPYVNHVPTLTGGIGARDLHRFYEDFFCNRNPASLKMTLVSRTVGSDRVVDEMVLRFTHDCVVPWMLPGVPPTGRDVEVALVSIVRIVGGKLAHEHIYWDQATVLVQLGLLGAEGLPVAGREAARKVLDKDVVASNALIEEW